ncbi:GyrI-like domain-containing protein [Heyndrickxia sp. NPDC080065]|uniref:GyrI-like domain-containing protein n=1 Tax=Heyndrickxia sp. NPDC080065 TaxID=3390568 RepID=UPI003CFCF06F
MIHSSIATFECKIVKKDYKLIGQSITANFPQSFPDAAIKIQLEFEKRRDEIVNSCNKEIMFSPYMCNGIVATYFACLEVNEITNIPEGMIGINLPLTTYAMISCSNKTIDQGHPKLFEWMKQNNYKQKWFDHSFPIEIYYFEENVEEEKVEILIPIID